MGAIKFKIESEVLLLNILSVYNYNFSVYDYNISKNVSSIV